MDKQHGDGQDRQDQEMDALLRAARHEDDTAATLPANEAELLDYLAGVADEATSARIREALVSSPALRGDILEMAADVDRLEEIVTTPEPWVESRARARRPRPWQAVRRIFEDFWRQPAFVAAAVFLLMAYPTFQYLGGGGDGPTVGPARTLHLDAGGPTVRGDADAPLPRLVRDLNATGLTVTLWSDVPYAADERVGLEVRSGERLVWSAAAWPVAPDPQEPERLDLRLNTRVLDPGPVTITVTRGTGVMERYMFEME